MRREPLSPVWETEAALAADFIAWAAHHGWTAYAETAEWDILLVRPEDGFQIGVEAKLSLNVKVLCQTLEHDHAYGSGTGPDCWAVLVPGAKAVNGLAAIARRLGVVIITGWKPETWGRWKGPAFRPALPTVIDSWHDNDEFSHQSWPDRCPDQRHPLPDWIPDVAAGASGPVKLTTWKVKAIKIAVILQARGYVTRADFKALDIDYRRWIHTWIKPIGEGRWVADPAMPDFRAQHPVNFEQIKADLAKWLPVTIDLTPLPSLLDAPALAEAGA
jgi:hypothetical protein